MPASATLFRRPALALPVCGALGFAILATLVFASHGAAAQSAAGTVTGRVLWGSCIRAIPLPMDPATGQAQPGSTAPGAPDMQQPGRPIPSQINGLPAGAVLVAVQNTNVSARTDEAGHFTLSGVPAGTYMTVAAGPVADSLSATAERPNVFVNGGQTIDVGTLTLGGPTPLGLACRFPNGMADTAPAPADSVPADAPGPPTP